ncbi:preprotein translocase subunit SecY [Candidatus Micrarchaeota archaeon CG10_big_fil_rev_8_21_14_0_10_45_29]|nr:MAG: preprotein translocase subunit SecY [Candidatus Micrarchaeota archaeon CG10_big_fil_rev_8_21_14_0_10_45_29]
MATPLAILRPILSVLPEVKSPELPPSFFERIMWTSLALFLFFAMYNTLALGVDPSVGANSDFLQIVTASNRGSLLTTGIGPIVLASIFLQLFVGAKLLEVNMKDPEEKKLFHGTQKLLAILLCFFEAAIFVFMAGMPMQADAAGNMLFGGQIDVATGKVLSFGFTHFFVLLQIALASIGLLYLDEIVSKYGLGSGISLFIAAGVSFAIAGGSLAILFGSDGLTAALSSGGAQVIAKALLTIMPIIFTILVFLVIVYIEGIKVEIPLAFERARGIGTGFPIKFMYVSNIPVILAFALLANFQFLAMIFSGIGPVCIIGEANNQVLTPSLACGPGGFNALSVIGVTEGGGTAGAPPKFTDGIMYLISPVYNYFGHDYGAQIQYYTEKTTPVFGIPEWLHIIIYIIFLMVLCVIFGQFWVDTTGMGPKDVAEQLNSAGLQIPGYRRDPRIVTAMLEKYIPPIVVMGSAFVGLLAGLADLTGALGTGTGILLTVGIVYRMYQDIEKQNVISQNFLMSSLLGKK